MALGRLPFKLWGFHGGLSLPGRKRLSACDPVAPALLPRRLVLPLQQHVGASARPVVTVGERVRKGQLLARADGYLSASLHAPSSGIVVAIEERAVAHPSGLSAPCLVVANDGLEEWCELPAALKYWEVEPVELRRRVEEAGIVGLGGAAFPAAVKLDPDPALPIELLLLNGAECEPYISCDDRLMRERPRKVIEGMLIMRHTLGAREAILAIEEDKPEAYQIIASTLSELGPRAEGVSVRKIPSRYPIGGERQLIRVVTGYEVPSRGLPAELGIVCHNVATAAAVYDAVVEGRPLISRYLTVTGAGVRHPRVLEVLIGTPVRELIEQSGGYAGEVERLIMGGPMTGIALQSDTVPVVKGSNCILVAATVELAEPAVTRPCIRCGACADVCPAKLLPQQLYWYARAKDFARIQDYHLFDCIECGCCAAVCPSHLPLVQYYRFAKSEIRSQQRETQRAAQARRRYEARLRRREGERQKKAARLSQKALELQSPESEDRRKAAIVAAVARVKAKKAEAAPAPVVGKGKLLGDEA
jgi:electron transport complex protein RnfC